MKTSTKIAVIRPDGPNYAVVVSLHDTSAQASSAIEAAREHSPAGSLTQAGTFLDIEDVTGFNMSAGDRFRHVWG